jgi:hypothetical protein
MMRKQPEESLGSDFRMKVMFRGAPQVMLESM